MPSAPQRVKGRAVSTAVPAALFPGRDVRHVIRPARQRGRRYSVVPGRADLDDGADRAVSWGVMSNRWESEYRAGRWAYLKGLQEAARYGVVAAHLRHTMPPGALLDVGCGEAILAGYLARDRVTRYVGVDISQAALDLAQLPRDWGRLVCRPLEDYAPDSGERFTAIIFNEVLFFTDQPGTMLERYRAWLAPDGVLIVSMYQTPRPESGARRSVEAVWAALDGPGWTALDEVSLTNVTKQLTWRLRLVRNNA
jgi:SAM-dependent methyltransferase